MKLELISFETAKLAKEKGFNHPVNDYYMGSGRVFSSLNPENHNKEPITKEKYSSPTQHLLQKWLREVHGINIDIYSNTNMHSYFLSVINRYKPNDATATIKDDEGFIKDFASYEQALEHGLKEALNMIES